MTVFLSVQQVVTFHDEEIDAPLTDWGKLDGAVARPYSGFGDHLKFPTLWGQAAALLEGIIQAHAFLEGNKRAAWISTVAFLELNGFQVVNLKQTAMADYIEEIAKHVHSHSEIALWLFDHAQSY